MEVIHTGLVSYTIEETILWSNLNYLTVKEHVYLKISTPSLEGMHFMC